MFTEYGNLVRVLQNIHCNVGEAYCGTIGFSFVSFVVVAEVFRVSIYGELASVAHFLKLIAATLRVEGGN